MPSDRMPRSLDRSDVSSRLETLTPPTRLRQLAYLVIRAGGILLLAGVLLAMPPLSPNQPLLAAIAAFVCAPLAILVELRFPMRKGGISAPAFDLLCVVTFVHLLPEAWHAALLVAVIVTLSATVQISRSGYLPFLLLLGLMLVGMTFAGLVHEVPDALPTMCVVLICLPTILAYTSLQTDDLLRMRAASAHLESLRQIAAGIGHDFNNLFQGLRGHADLAAASRSGEHIDDLLRTLDRAECLNEQLRAFTDDAPLEARRFDLAKEIEDVLRIVGPILPTGVNVFFEHDGEPIELLGDPGRIGQVLLNLVVNAGHAMADRPGPINISASRESDKAGWIRCDVTDRGCGIPQAHLERVFEPFFTTKPGGHGLGLAGALRIVEAHGGHLELDSEVGVGTTARLLLPAPRST